MLWSDIKGAPAPGTALAALDDVPEGQVYSGMLGSFPFILLRHPERMIRGFVNLCPHQYLPLDYRAPAALTEDGSRLMCANHGAVFDITTGVAAGALCAGASLSPIPVIIENGTIIISE